MNIIEKFSTLQCEGRYLGVPSFFLRSTGCNLRCAWKNPNGSVTLCDSPFTSWEPQKGQKMNSEDVLNELSKHPQIKHVVITGGEPTLQIDLASIVKDLISKDYKVTIETNGTRYMHLPGAFMSISPKLASSYSQIANSVEYQMHTRNNLNWPNVVKKYIENNDYQIKFVYNEKKDLDEILYFCDTLKVPHDNIVLMPQGITTEQFKEKEKEIFKTCIEYGFHYSPRTHIDIFGNVRGV